MKNLIQPRFLAAALFCSTFILSPLNAATSAHTQTKSLTTLKRHLVYSDFTNRIDPLKASVKIASWTSKNKPAKPGDETERIVSTTVTRDFQWLKPFPKSQTSQDNFFIEASWCDAFPPSKVSMMHSSGTFSCFSNDEIHAVKLPCRQSKANQAIVIIAAIPSKGPGHIAELYESVKGWQASKFKDFLTNFKETDTAVAMPRCTWRWELKPFKKSYGDQATKLSEIALPWPDLKIAFDQIAENRTLNEDGFKFAETATYSLIPKAMLVVPPVVSQDYQDRSNSPPGMTYLHYHQKPGMIIDQPFLVMVFDSKTGRLLDLTKVKS